MTISEERRQERVAPAGMSAAEWEVRQELAACYRIVDHLGWTSLIYNHISARVPDSEHILVNPFGLLYSEVTASNLVKVDLDGNIVGHNDWPVNRVGIVLHTALHAQRPSITCVIHTHSIAGSAISALEEGLGHNFIMSATVHGHVAYHDFEGGEVSEGEQVRLAENLGDKSMLILRNHGLLTCGASIPEALNNMVALEGVCQMEFAILSTGRPVHAISDEALRRTSAAPGVAFDKAMRPLAEKVFAALQRQVDAKDPSYRM